MSYFNFKSIGTAVAILFLNNGLPGTTAHAQDALQNNPALIPWQHYTIRRLETQGGVPYQNTNIIAFNNPIRRGLIDLAAADPATHYVFFITRFGTIYDSVLLNDEEYKQIIIDKKITPFDYANSIYIHNIEYLDNAIDALRAHDKYVVNQAMTLSIPELSQAKSALEQLIILEDHRKAFHTALGHINLPLAKLDVKKENAAAEKIPGTYIITKKGKTTFTIYYNYDTLVSIAAATVNNNTGVIYMQNYRDETVDSMQLNPSKIDELLKSKINIFLLYRSWLEKQWREQNDAINELWKYKVSYRKNPANAAIAVATAENTAVSSRLQVIQERLSVINEKIKALIMPAKALMQAQFAYMPVPGERMYMYGGNWGYTISFQRGRKEYELTDHRGNVLVTVSDKKVALSDNGTTIKNYNADVVSAQDYYSGGMLEIGRTVNTSSYAMGFNGKRKDNNIHGEGNAYDFGGRIYDPRSVTWYSTDVHPKAYLSPYSFARNNPVNIIDPDGNDEFHFHYLTVYLPAAQAGPDGILHIINKPVTYTWVNVIKDNLKNTFYVHKDLAKANSSFSVATPTQFFPDADAGSLKRTGITSSTYFGFINRPDDDLTSLIKILDNFPELEGIVRANAFSIRDPGKLKTQQEQNQDFWRDIYRRKSARETAQREEEIKNSLMIGVLLTVFAPEDMLPTAFEIFGESGAITTRVAAERYALGTTYKGFINANNLIKNNKTFDLFSLEKRTIVDVTTLDSKKAAAGEIYKKLDALGSYKSNFFENRVLQIYVKDGAYSAEELSKLENSLKQFIDDWQLKVKVNIDVIK